MDINRLEELAALEAAGALEEPDKAEFSRIVAEAELVLATIRHFRESAAALALALPRLPLPAVIKDRLFQEIRATSSKGAPRSETGTSTPPFSYISGESDEGWHQVKVPGAYFKLLSNDQVRGYVVALGRLEPNTRYPAHEHRFAEDVYILSGDLTVNGRTMVAGDFHRAESGTWHDENFSENGCTILIVISSEDLAAQMAQSAA